MQQLENFFEQVDERTEACGEGQDTVKVYSDSVLGVTGLELLKDNLHGFLEGGRSIFESEWHLRPLERGTMCNEGCLGLVFLAHSNLPIGKFQV